jgi:hypothetical protein
MVLGFVAGALRLPSWVFLALSVVGAAAMGVVGYGLRSLVGRTRQVSKALRDLSPAYALPYNGRAGFHIGMWSPYLERTGKPVIVVTTEEYSYQRVAGMYPSLPVIFAPGGPVRGSGNIPAECRAAFYVPQRQERRVRQVRGVTHVFVHHGDSDKMTSACRGWPSTTSSSPLAGRRRPLREAWYRPAVVEVQDSGPTADRASVRSPGRSPTPNPSLYAPTWHGFATS